MSETLSPFMSASNGHLGYRLIREGDPGGFAVEHRIVLTHRLIDRLHEAGQLSALRHEAATKLRDDYERARPKLADASARSLDGPLGAGDGGDLIADEPAWKRYCGAMRACGDCWDHIRRLVIEDWAPWQTIAFARGLDRLARHYGVMS
jgi:hypothetical protein